MNIVGVTAQLCAMVFEVSVVRNDTVFTPDALSDPDISSAAPSGGEVVPAE
jgi:hypothetical protein